MSLKKSKKDLAREVADMDMDKEFDFYCDPEGKAIWMVGKGLEGITSLSLQKIDHSKYNELKAKGWKSE